MELKKEGQKTISYLTCVAVGGFKGFHLHRIRIANYVCIRGSVRVELYHFEEGWRKEEVILEVGDKLQIPTDIPTGLFNIGAEEAWIVNFPNPPYDPEIKEQIEYSKEDLEKGIKK